MASKLKQQSQLLPPFPYSRSACCQFLLRLGLQRLYMWPGIFKSCAAFPTKPPQPDASLGLMGVCPWVSPGRLQETPIGSISMPVVENPRRVCKRGGRVEELHGKSMPCTDSLVSPKACGSQDTYALTRPGLVGCPVGSGRDLGIPTSWGDDLLKRQVLTSRMRPE